MIEQEQLLSFERGLWRNDPAIYHATLVPEAILVFAETGVISRDHAVEAIRQENAEGQAMGGRNLLGCPPVRLAADVALLHYRVKARWEHEAEAVVALASCVYVLRKDSWKLAFHQQTEVHEPS
jgi:hypothetical protein